MRWVILSYFRLLMGIVAIARSILAPIKLEILTKLGSKHKRMVKYFKLIMAVRTGVALRTLITLKRRIKYPLILIIIHRSHFMNAL